MRKLILQIRYTIFSRLLCVRHLQTILPYSPYLYGIFAIYSNVTPHTRIYFCKAESFFAELELTFSIHPIVKDSIFPLDSTVESHATSIGIDDIAPCFTALSSILSEKHRREL